MKRIASILQTLNHVDRHVTQSSVRNESVSKWSVGMQIEHTLRATIGILQTVIDSRPYREKVKKSLLRRVIFTTGVIPRGRGKSPEAAIPEEEPSESHLRELLVKANQVVEEAADAVPDGWWEHFLFGVLKKEDALRFVEIHNKHHLKIISDILTKN